MLISQILVLTLRFASVGQAIGQVHVDGSHWTIQILTGLHVKLQQPRSKGHRWYMLTYSMVRFWWMGGQ